MKILKNRDRIITFLSIAIIIISPVILIIRKQFISHRIKKRKHTQSNLLTQTGTDNNFKEKLPPYNYDKMINVLAKYQDIQRRFYATFPQFIANQKNLNKLNTILNKLKNEKYRFKNHLKMIRVSYKKNASNKKKNSLRYYFRVLNDSIDNTEYMIEKFDPNNMHPISKKGRMS